MVMIPINSAVDQVLRKYNGNPPPAISNEKMNEYLKELGKTCNLNDPIETTSTKGGKRIKEIFNKYELMTVHTAEGDHLQQMHFL